MINSVEGSKTKMSLGGKLVVFRKKPLYAKVLIKRPQMPKNHHILVSLPVAKKLTIKVTNVIKMKEYPSMTLNAKLI